MRSVDRRDLARQGKFGSRSLCFRLDVSRATADSLAMKSLDQDGPMGVDDNHSPVKLLLTYDPIPDQREAYFRYILGEFVPALEQMGLTMCDAWYTAYGAYPLRLNGFIAQDMSTLEEILASETFKDLETRLQELVSNYARRIVPRSSRFQF